MTALESTRLLLLVVHLTAVASVLVGWVLQLRPGRRRRLLPMIAGAALAAATGAALVVARQLADLPVDVAKIAVKLLVTALLLAAVIRAASQRRSGSAPAEATSRRYLQAAGLLALGNVLIAVAWT